MSARLPDLRRDSQALRVSKRPEPVRVVFAEQDGVCATLEGSVAYRAGDAILTGVQAESWPLPRAAFLKSYAPVDSTREGTDGNYVKRPSVSFARRLDRPMEVPVGWRSDPLHGEPGDWLILYEDASYGVVRDAIFRASYGPAPGETRWPPP